MALLLAALPLLLVSNVASFWAAGPVTFAAATLALLVFAGLVGGLVLLLDPVLRAIPGFYKAAVVATWTVVMGGFFLLPQAVPWVLLALVASSAIVGGAAAVLLHGGWGRMSRARRTLLLTLLSIGVVGGVVLSAWVIGDGWTTTAPLNAAALSRASVAPRLTVPDPSQPGAYPVRTIVYGSGTDLHRAEFGVGVDLMTHPVNGSALLNGWSELRRAYGGFGPEALPLNGRVWYPVGDGPFPLVLVVHGNHVMEDFSDTGYAYLGDLLASRGFLIASVDENFLNYSLAADLLMFSALQNENGARGWLLLEHMAAWRTWNQTSGNPFSGKVDLDNVALIGHSRGGEAVAIAAAFNRLPFDPDDATVAFNYGFGIRSVIAIAPIDKQYQPGGRPTPLRDVNYLVLHGSHDMQAPAFMGAAQYERVQFSGDRWAFKAGVYIYGANHGQFNTVWGRQDNPLPAGWLYNTRQLLPADQQAQIAKVYIAGFLEATLHEKLEYLPLFRDPRSPPGWMPETIMLHQYMDTSTRLVATFQDLDASATTLGGGHIEGQNLTVWRHGTVPTKIQALPWATHETRAAYLGWDGRGAEGGPPATYSITLPAGRLQLTHDDALVFSLADAKQDPDARQPSAMRTSEASEREPIDLSLEVEDGAGAMAQLPLSHVALLQPQIETQLMKAPILEPSASSEAVFETYTFPLADFTAVNPNLDPSRLTTVRFVFDRTPAAVVLLEDVGFRAAPGEPAP